MHRLFFFVMTAIYYQSAFAEDIPISMKKFGLVSVGMKVENAYRKLGLPFPAGYTESDPGATECNYYHPTNELSFKVKGAVPQIMRIETSDKRAVTPSGIRVGDPISKVKKLLQSKLSDSMQHYSDDPNDRTLVLVSNDGKFAMRFEVTAGVVTEIYLGYESHIHYVEGCS